MHNDRVKGEAHTHTKKSSEIEGACWWDEMTWVPETESLRLKKMRCPGYFHAMMLTRGSHTPLVKLSTLAPPGLHRR